MAMCSRRLPLINLLFYISHQCSARPGTLDRTGLNALSEGHFPAPGTLACAFVARHRLCYRPTRPCSIAQRRERAPLVPEQVNEKQCGADFLDGSFNFFLSSSHLGCNTGRQSAG